MVQEVVLPSPLIQPTEERTSPMPLVYACSGCSSAAQLANTLAVRLDRRGMAEMSCIAGVGGDVRPLLATARSQKPMLVLDGCPLHCARHCLERHGLVPTYHLDLSKSGIKKRAHEDASDEETDFALNQVVLPIIDDIRRQA